MFFQSSFEEWLASDPRGRVICENLPTFYTYYQERGFFNWALRNTLLLLLNLFNASLLFFLIVFVNWNGLFSCQDPVDCASNALNPSPLSNIGTFTVLLTLSFLLYFGYQVRLFVLTIPKMKIMQRFYTKELNITNSDLQVLPFQRLVSVISDLSGESSGLIALKLSQLICKDDNTLLALYHSKILPLDRKLIGFGPVKIDYFSKSLEFLLRKTIIHSSWRFEIVDEKYFNSKFNLNSELIRKRILLWTLVSLLASPFIFVFILVHLFFSYTEALYDSDSFASWKSFSNRSRWLFRHFNELPHLFDDKLKSSYKPANEYLGLFKSRTSVIVQRFVVYMFSAFAAVLITFLYLFGEKVLNIELFSNGRTLTWILLSVIIPIIAFSRSSLPGPDFSFHANQSLRKFFHSTKYIPDGWRGNGESIHTHKALSSVFQLRLINLVSELISVFISPFIMFFIVLPKITTIVSFLESIVDHDIEASDGSDELNWSRFQLDDNGKVEVLLKVHKGPDNEQICLNKIVSSLLHFAAIFPSFSPINFDKFLATFPSKTNNIVDDVIEVIYSQDMSIGSTIAQRGFDTQNVTSMSYVARSAYYSTLHDNALQSTSMMNKRDIEEGGNRSIGNEVGEVLNESPVSSRNFEKKKLLDDVGDDL
ncbi:hypothetical protein P9112_010643 [Eukaryota sp. TZLM1-RC]